MQIPGYQIVRLIAEGGMASVYLAVQESLGRRVALKLLKKFDDVYQSARFHNEGRIIASLNHRNIITIYDIGVIGERHYISMEFLEDGDLEERINSGMSTDAALDLVEVIGSCLDFLHRKDIIHRDIKPANILFHKDGTPILTDFGVAKQQEVDIKLTRDGTALGSPYYISPEQAECKSLDGRADIYGLGIILYEMLTGVKPYGGDSYIETMIAHLTSPIPSLPPEHASYQPLLDRMIAKDRNDRFATAEEMIEYLQDIRNGRPHAVTVNKVTDVTQDHQNPETTNSHSAINGALPALRKVNGHLLDNSRILMAGTLTILFVISLVFINNNPSMLAEAVQTITGIGAEKTVQTAALHVKDDSEPKYEQYLLQAKLARRKLRFATPEKDNAYYYYQLILKQDPNHEAALKGVDEIAEIYADLVEWALGMHKYRKAKEYLQTGLEVDSGNKRLLELERGKPFK